MPEYLNPSDLGMCEHGNYTENCAACKERSLDNKEDQEKVKESQENNGYIDLKDRDNAAELGENNELERIFQSIKNGSFDVKKWENISLDLRRGVIEKIELEDYRLLFNLIEDNDFREDNNSIAFLFLKELPHWFIENMEKFRNFNQLIPRSFAAG